MLAGWYLALLLSYPLQSGDVTLVEPHHTHFSVTDDKSLGIEALGIIPVSPRISVIFGGEYMPSRSMLGEDSRREFKIGSELRAKLGVVIEF